MDLYYKFEFDIKSDLLRIRTKIEEYQIEKKDEYGWQYVKDYVRCAFYYRTPNNLIEAFDAFINNQSKGKYKILEIKNKMNSPL